MIVCVDRQFFKSYSLVTTFVFQPVNSAPYTTLRYKKNFTCILKTLDFASKVLYISNKAYMFRLSSVGRVFS